MLAEGSREGREERTEDLRLCVGRGAWEGRESWEGREGTGGVEEVCGGWGLGFGSILGRLDY